MATVRQRRLARALRRTREALGLKPEDIARELRWDRSKISRIETSRVKAKPGDVAELLDLYGVTSPDRDALLNLATEANQRGWWTAFGDVFTGSYIELEHDASLIRSWQAQLIPGLLQIEEYARAVIAAARPDENADSIEMRVKARMARRTLLGEERAPTLHVVIDEAVLRRRIGGPAVMRRQLSYLWDAAHRPNVTVQVLPFAAGAHAGVEGSFIILSFDDPADPDVPYSEGPFGDVYPESTGEQARIRLNWDRISNAALPHQESAAFIAELMSSEE